MAKEKIVIDQDIKTAIEKDIEAFNASKLAKNMKYQAAYKSNYIYLFRSDYPGEDFSPICRLTYRGDLQNMDFAIYKYSSETYSPSEWMFPGSDLVDGTVTGAMKAGMKAY